MTYKLRTYTTAISVSDGSCGVKAPVAVRSYIGKTTSTQTIQRNPPMWKVMSSELGNSGETIKNRTTSKVMKHYW